MDTEHIEFAMGLCDLYAREKKTNCTFCIAGKSFTQHFIKKFGRHKRYELSGWSRDMRAVVGHQQGLTDENGYRWRYLCPLHLKMILRQYLEKQP